MPEQAALELQPLVAAFNQMLSRLEMGYQQLSQVSADMAHDLRTPISTLIRQTEVARARRAASAIIRRCSAPITRSWKGWRI
ncbi:MULTISPECIES: hypothetical protein [unclassified Enterobacter]|jgi:signal transduction histidine kinase|uniref:hypothetical protein n=1 Tax=unclassified Enterobacter TaxID=2608935 RepID=UPI00185D2A27|nr:MULTISPECIES: hypothetical protein [unclassified Enterobacter]MBB3307030.1 signal transduction histidine kinase [Enterobacter sp. Sphag1F]NYI15646.1 signal transduction histidine kinase [Enterobacter sp. Sphag71]